MDCVQQQLHLHLHQEEQQGFHGLHQQFHQHHQLLYGRGGGGGGGGGEGTSLGTLDTQTPQTQTQTEPQIAKKRSYFQQYARFGEKMGETHQQQQSSRLGLLKGGGGGEIVEVQGGHIVRSTGRKDRHSKVCTAKGPRDRRVRLSANTAIQFYDVQDRLGYDRPSKAVDWLINKAKSAIDELAELPPWKPTATTNTTSSQPSEQNQDEEEEQNQNEMGVGKRGGGGDLVSSRYGYEHQHSLNNNNPNNSSSGFLPPSLDSDSIADTIKSFFPTVATTSSSPIHFQNYPPDLLSRTSSQTQDLRLSLHSFQDPILLHHHSNQEPHFPISAPMSFDPNTSNNNTWSDQQSSEMSRFQRMVAWNAGGDSSSGGGGFVFNSQPLSQSLLGQNQFFQQRGPLQSSNSPQIRVWSDPNAVGNHYQLPTLHPSSLSGTEFASGGFSGFRVPARIQGDEEQDPASNKPSSASRH